MNNKTFITIIIAIILALICVSIIYKKEEITPIIDTKSQTAQEKSVVSEAEINTQETKSEKVLTNIEKAFIEKENKINNVSSETHIKTDSATDENYIHEAGVIEEVEDFGIKKDNNGLIEVTKEFKLKSPTKYSFVDFGFLEKVIR